jgi:hypothetical protein
MNKGEAMRKYVAAAVLALALIVPAIAMAVSLQPSQVGSGCPSGDVGTYHFVNNQVTPDFAPGGLLTVTFTGHAPVTVAPTMVLKSVQQFFVTSTGSIVSASTNLPGKLVLSDFSCKKKD